MSATLDWWTGDGWAPLDYAPDGTAPPPPPELRIERDDWCRPVRVLIGELDVTPLVARVQTNTTMQGTTLEVVLWATGRRAPAPPKTKDGFQ